MHPSVKHLPLSPDRVNQVIQEMLSTFEQHAIARKALTPISLTKEDRRRNEENFTTVGISNIVDKIWFVEAVFGDVSYGYQGIGGDYGRGLADAENKYIVDTILDKCRKNMIVFEGEIQPSDILRGLEYLEHKEMDAGIILTSVGDHVQLWRHRNMISRGKLAVSSHFSGLGHDIDILFCRELPEGTSIVVDPRKIGDFLIKEAIPDVVSIAEIPADEAEIILEELAGFTREKLDESVWIRVYETVKANIVDPNAAIILRRNPSKGQFLLVGE